VRGEKAHPRIADSLGRVSPLAIRRAARRFRRHGTALLAVLVIGSAMAVHHAGPPMSVGHDDGAMDGAIELCLGVFVAVGAAVAALAVGVISLGRWRPPIDLRPTGLSGAVVRPEPRARAGPVLLSLLCVSRR
jgi:hypothetical protein